ncbi:MAG: helix-turn-helix transcriptional regulator [Clostridiales bacterium]|nr:helix-turn-helix transcriptional regulator [Clostridiales bacterium]
MNLKGYIKESFNTPIGGYLSQTIGHTQAYLHWHTHYEVKLIVSGNYTTTSHNINYSSHNPALFIHRPYTLHSGNATPDKPYLRFIIHIDKSIITQFPPSLLDTSIYANATMLRVDPNESELANLCELCDQIVKNERDLRGNALRSAMIFHYAEQILECGRGEIITTNFSYIQDVLQLISDSISEPLTIPQLCEKFDVGHSKLLSDFKATTGTTYKKYMTDLRMTRARELLIRGESIINASLECGYSSEAHFVKSYREYYGITPGEFVKSLDS